MLGTWRTWGLGGLLAGVCAAAVAAPACPQPLRIAFSDAAAPPALHGQGAAFAEPPGWEVEAVRDALKRTGCQAELQRLPTRRVSALLAQGKIDFGLLYGATPERLATMAFPKDADGRPDVAWAPVFGSLVLVARPGTVRPPPGWDGRRLPDGWRVGAVPGSVQAGLARERGWTVEPVSAFEQGLTMLQAGRFDLLLTSREALTPEQRAGYVEWATAGRQPFFVPASMTFAKRHPAWTRDFWKELCHAVRRAAPDVRPAQCGIVPPATLR